MNQRRAALIAIGGMAGAALRWAIVDTVFVATGGVPWGVLAVNVAGSALLAWAIIAARRSADPRPFLDVFGVGFCGGLTTFSAFAVDSAALLRSGDAGSAAVYVALTLGLGIGAAMTVTTVAGSGWRPGSAGPAEPSR